MFKVHIFILHPLFIQYMLQRLNQVFKCDFFLALKMIFFFLALKMIFFFLNFLFYIGV